MLKPDARDIITHIQHLKNQPWLPASQRRWPDYLFHFTDLNNAVQILTDGRLFARSVMEQTGRLRTDIASPDVIGATESQRKDHVRFYFRPRTPTQYRNEGFRPVHQRELGGAHCPVPISFIFDARQILTRDTTRFSDGNLAAGAQTGDTAAFFSSLPFQKIYHEGWMDEADKRSIIYHRHAEVIVPHSIGLSSLKWIWCRSQAEFETLIHLLPEAVYGAWSGKVGVGGRAGLFYRQWSFVEKADLSASGISLTFSASQTPGPFRAELEITESATGQKYFWRKNDFYARQTQSFSLSKMTQPEHYVVKFLLDKQLAYQNEYLNLSELPF